MEKEKVSEAIKLPGEKYSSRIRARFWITGEKQGYLGIGRIQLLENVARYGSINRAAKEMGMSYKKAWKLIEEMNNMSDRPLVVKAQGGKSGGGTSLTEEGESLIKRFRELESELIEFLENASKRF
ncbi:winged helix-turn-helix domain-containing protein [Thiomicrorhabdus sp. ZW0627]|uniref:winged helix-turn-helix domain-containing protein n=1 Tax=Thiomicrorhabdus sp. ZW0627 TaxID=3039774 RepID=UPI002436DD15|nr:winged helix-turn-helix domain-containing protein [Thiomicrorhabdus sp. ZW0627]MDG6773683.1 winged helix-turn-helix domain-containing protein [Thiomicrorhabdus sp. ZW0627]